MKILTILVVLLSLTGCVSYHDRDIALKKSLCVQFAMTWQEFKFPGTDETDIICLDENTGEHVYMELVPEKNARPNVY